MKKLLLIALIGILGNGSIIKGCFTGNPIIDSLIIGISWAWNGTSEKYEFLNKLPKDSKIRTQCGQLRRAFFWPGSSEIQCNDISAEFFELAVQRRDILLQKSEGLTDTSKIKELLSSPDAVPPIDQAQKLKFLNLIDLILSDTNNEKQTEEFNFLIESSHRMAGKEVLRRIQVKDKRELKEQLFPKQ